MKRLLVVLLVARTHSLRIEGVRSEFVVAKTLAPVLRPLRPATRFTANEVVEVKSFSATDSDGLRYCGLGDGGASRKEAALLLTTNTKLPLAFLTSVALAARDRNAALILGSGSSARLAAAAFEALGVEARLVPPAEAPALEPARPGTLYVDLAGSENIRNDDYLSLLSPAANAVVEDGILFADLAVTDAPYAVDAELAATLLRPVLGALEAYRYAPSTGSFLTPPALKRDTRAVEEYADFVAWGRDADNRGRRLGLDRFYDDRAMRTLLEEGSHENLLDTIHTVQQSGLGLHKPAPSSSSSLGGLLLPSFLAWRDDRPTTRSLPHDTTLPPSFRGGSSTNERPSPEPRPLPASSLPSC